MVENKVGDKFGRLTIVDAANPDYRGNKKWLCRCDCGKQRVFRQASMRIGTSRSCGCLQKDAVRKANTTHGHNTGNKISSEYICWANMISRCHNINNTHYRDYGGRGIKVCLRWRRSFQNFFIDNGVKPSQKHTLERINNDGNYEPDNCRWATRQEQVRNTRCAIKINGVPLIELANKHGLEYSLLFRRYKKGDRGRKLLRPSARINRHI